ncbi:hypothetical protein Q5424_04915 [Conexibacter sp. JD483]|uniref:hypothetical protein n=1 Tax=unclassified Conexibacter TaxID=2627773 RepID=UPI002723C149|nr:MULTISPECIES: hypothetical protein [unclassified Conexibacter]MDO8184674.1 hypothetical protein [Conexibacter sp. CPCC 205706]MDO8197980.1 hypothetical protein [Conexibacter sp. CPCC 205762]MDR9368410.1 hypothetical protein [Conexibacter sp. JD483]
MEVVQASAHLRASIAEEAGEVRTGYESFLTDLNHVILSRGRGRDAFVNLFSTNIDIAVEAAADKIGIELNDGFSGTLDPQFSPSNYGTVMERVSRLYRHRATVPVFNLVKIHGSLSWAFSAGEGSRHIRRDPSLGHVDAARDALTGLGWSDLRATTGLETLDRSEPVLETLRAWAPDPDTLDKWAEFQGAYRQLPIINPTKQKFGDTVLDQTYFDLFRIFANELEYEETLLIVAGFSCRDEHIRTVLERSARQNPTLTVLVFAYMTKQIDELRAALAGCEIPNRNIVIIDPGEGNTFTIRDIGHLLRSVADPASVPEKAEAETA